MYADGGESEILLTGSVVANPGRNCEGVVYSGGYNRAEGTTCAALNEPTDQQNVAPLLGPLANNGGPTFTHRTLPGSPLRNAIPNGTDGLCTAGLTDQRGITRPQGPGCDVGSVEVVP